MLISCKESVYQRSSPFCSIHPSVYAHQDELLFIRERGGGREGKGDGGGRETNFIMALELLITKIINIHYYDRALQMKKKKL